MRINLGFQFVTLVIVGCFIWGNINKAVANKDTALFVFGDSIYDPGNSVFLGIPNAKHWPYGETFFHFPTGRFSDGRLISDFIATYMGLPLWRPFLAPGNHNFLHGANFAASAAAVLPGDSETGTLSFYRQLSYFKEVSNNLMEKLGEENATKLLNEAIYLSCIGGIDYVMKYEELVDATEAEQQVFVNMVISNITKAVKEIYRLGGRKFAFQNVAPIGSMPVATELVEAFGGKGVEELNALMSLHNEALAKAVAGLESQLSGFKYLVFDLYNMILDSINNPSKYGFTDVTNACCSGDCRTEPYSVCSDPNQYLWFDNSHPTEHAYMQLAELLWEGGSNATTPYTMKQLFELNQPNWSSSGTWSVT